MSFEIHGSIKPLEFPEVEMAREFLDIEEKTIVSLGGEVVTNGKYLPFQFVTEGARFHYNNHTKQVWLIIQEDPDSYYILVAKHEAPLWQLNQFEFQRARDGYTITVTFFLFDEPITGY